MERHLTLKEEIVVQRDLDWLDEATAWGWRISEKAAPFWRLWGIRHARAMGIVLKAYLGFRPFAPDWKALWYAEWRAYAIRRGWC